MEAQTQIDFKKSLHHGGENNSESQKFYNDNLEKFSNQCRIVFEQLLTGRRLTTVNAIQIGIGDLRRRKKDLIDKYKVPIKSETKKGGYKEIYLEKSFIEKYLAEVTLKETA